MSNPAQNRNIGHFLHGVFGSTARGAFDSGSYVAATYVTATGITIDRNALPRKFRSCKVVHPIRLDLASGNTLTVDGSLTHASASGGTYAAVATAAEKAFTNAGTSTSVITSPAYQASYDLTNVKRFIRIKTRHKGNTTATGLMAVTLGTAVVVFGGPDETPASSS